MPAVAEQSRWLKVYLLLASLFAASSEWSHQQVILMQSLLVLLDSKRKNSKIGNRVYENSKPPKDKDFLLPLLSVHPVSEIAS